MWPFSSTKKLTKTLDVNGTTIRWCDLDGHAWLARVDVMRLLGRTKNSRLHRYVAPSMLRHAIMHRADGRRQAMLAIRADAAAALVAHFGDAVLAGELAKARPGWFRRIFKI